MADVEDEEGEDDDEELDEDEEGEDDDEDPAETLVEVSENATADHARVGELAAELRAAVEEKQVGLQAAAAAPDGDPAARAMAELHLVQMNATLFLLDEVGETLLSLLDSLASATTDNVLAIRDWADNEVEPLLDEVDGSGVPPGARLGQPDLAMIIGLIDQYCEMLKQGITHHQRDSEEYAAIHAQVTQVLALRGRVQQCVHG